MARSSGCRRVSGTQDCAQPVTRVPGSPFSAYSRGHPSGPFRPSLLIMPLNEQEPPRRQVPHPQNMEGWMGETAICVARHYAQKRVMPDRGHALSVVRNSRWCMLQKARDVQACSGLSARSSPASSGRES